MKDWRKDPFKPYLVARTRITPFQIATIMEYLANLIAWDDHLFQRGTIEAIDEATQLYIIAATSLVRR